jgi:hypothetical protein
MKPTVSRLVDEALPSRLKSKHNERKLIYSHARSAIHRRWTFQGTGSRI